MCTVQKYWQLLAEILLFLLFSSTSFAHVVSNGDIIRLHLTHPMEAVSIDVCQSVGNNYLRYVQVVMLMFASVHFDQCKCALYFRIEIVEIESHVLHEQNNDSIPTPPHTPHTHASYTSYRLKSRWVIWRSPIGNSCHCRQRNRTILYIPKTI